MRQQELTFAQEREADAKYLEAVRNLRQPQGIDDMEARAHDYRIIVCERYPEMREVFAAGVEGLIV